MVRYRPEIEPVVRWIEETPREQVFEKAVAQLKDGQSYRSLLSGLFLAGIRNIKPRPVGFKFHAVMVINSAHLLGQTSALSERLLPMFWALDNFKALAGRGRPSGRLGCWAGLTSRGCPHLINPERRTRRPWKPGTLTRPTRRVAGLLPGQRRGRDDGADLADGRARTSATSVTRRSSRPRAGGPCKRLAGNTPNGFFGR